MDSKNIIDIKNISVSRSGRVVLKNVSWKTRPVENWFILGNNGSGKTTLLEVLTGYLWPQEGKVTVLGECYGRTFLPGLRKRIGYVSTWILQRTRGYYLVEKIVASGTDASTYYWKEPDREILEKVRRVLEKFSCGHLARKKFGQLSSGEQFKVILCRALVNNPELLILDEPFAFLDMGARHKAYDAVTGIADSASAPQIILVTHHLEDVTPVFTHGLALKDGTIVRKGLKKNLLNAGVLKQVFDTDIRLPDFS